MRKLAWFVIIVFATILSIAIACAVSDPFKVAVSSMLNGVGGGILSGIGGAVQRLANTVNANVTYFTIYTLSILVVGGVMWIGVKRLWARRPAILQRQPQQTTYQGQPVYQPPQAIAAPPQQVQPPPPIETKVEEKKEAAT